MAKKGIVGLSGKRKRRRFRWVHWILAGLVILFVATGLLLALQPTVPLDRLARRLERAIRETSGRQVTFTGARCRIGLHPRLDVETIVAHGAAPDEPDLAALSSVAITVSLPALAGGLLDVEDLTIGDLSLHLPARGPRSAPNEPGPTPGGWLPKIMPLAFERVRIDQATLRLPGESEVGASLVLSNLGFRAPIHEGIQAECRATWRGHHAVLRLEGGGLNPLLRGPRIWPVRLEADTDFGGAVVEGGLRGDPFPTDPAFGLSVTLTDVQTAGLLPNGLQADTARLSAHARWRGLTPAALQASLDLQGQLDDLRLVIPHEQEQTTELRLLYGQVSYRPGNHVSVSGTGSLLEESFRFDADVGPVATWPPEDDVPYVLLAGAAGTRLAVKGDWTVRPGPDSVTFRSELRGERIGDLAPWTGFAADADLPFGAEVHGRLQKHNATVRIDQAHLGQTRLSGDIDLGDEGNGLRMSRRIDLRVDRLDLEELASLGGGGPVTVDPSDPGTTGQNSLKFDMPLIPTGLQLPDIELSVGIQNVIGTTLPIRSVKTELSFRDGWLERSPFVLTLAGYEWNGTCFLDMRKDVPLVGLKLHTDSAKVSDLLPGIRHDPDLSVEARSVSIAFETEGTTLRDLLDESAIEIEASEAQVSLPSPGQTKPRQFDIQDLKVSRPGNHEGVRGDATIRLQHQDFRIGFVALLQEASGESPRRLNTEVDITGEWTDFAVKGTLDLPISDLMFDADVQFSTTKPKRLTDLAGLGWNPEGRLAASGHITGRGGVWTVQNLDATLNRTRANGTLSISSSPDQLTWRFEGQSPFLQIEDLGMDFGFGDEDDSEPEPESQDDAARPMYGGITLEAREVHYAGTALGHGSLALELPPGRVVVDPLRLEGADHLGTMRLVVGAGSEDSTSQFELAVAATNLPVSVLGLVMPELTQSVSRVYADVNLHAGQPDEDEGLVAGLGGELGFALFPADLRSKYLDYWATGVIQSLGMSLTGQGESKVHCAAGRLAFTDGKAWPETLYLDTSRIRVRGTGWIDFAEGDLSLKMKPRPKRSTLLNLATPIKVEGAIQDPEVSISTGSLVETATRVCLWFVAAIDSLFGDNIPGYDFDGYMKMMQGVHP